jgi:DNA replication and repair protein RecF
VFIRQLDISNVRNINHAALVFDYKFNFFCGANGVGKTSVLEALYFLVSGKSFRTPRLRHFVQFGQQELLLFAGIDSANNDRDVKVGIRKHLAQPVEIKLNGEVQSSLLPVAMLIPMHVIAPDRSSLIDDDAECRRRFLDWGVFHVEQGFSVLWKQLRHVVKQRNALIKQQADCLELESWNQLLLSLSIQIQTMRADYLKQLEASFRVLVADPAFSMQLDQGWPIDRTLQACLQTSMLLDKRLGYSQYGAHRADVKLLYNGQLAKSHLSRGQRKLFNIYLVLAQIHHLYHAHGKRTICLIDDLASELDASNRKNVYQQLNALDCQMFITGITIDPVLVQQNYKLKLFHVEQGHFRCQP